MALILDTSVLLATLDADDPENTVCADLVREAKEDLIIPAPVLVELERLLAARGRLQIWEGFAERAAAGAYSLFEIHVELVLAAARLQSKYHDLPLGFVDAAVFVTCEALGERKVATLDHRHFSVLRTKDRKQLTLLPA